jgi:hypothetical protein
MYIISKIYNFPHNFVAQPFHIEYFAMIRDQDSDSAQDGPVSGGDIEWKAPHIGTPAALALQGT